MASVEAWAAASVAARPKRRRRLWPRLPRPQERQSLRRRRRLKTARPHSHSPSRPPQKPDPPRLRLRLRLRLSLFPPSGCLSWRSSLLWPLDYPSTWIATRAASFAAAISRNERNGCVGSQGTVGSRIRVLLLFLPVLPR